MDKPDAKMRAGFEEWLRTNPHYTGHWVRRARFDPDEYENDNTDHQWQAWQAALRSVGAPPPTDLEHPRSPEAEAPPLSVGAEVAALTDAQLISEATRRGFYVVRGTLCFGPHGKPSLPGFREP